MGLTADPLVCTLFPLFLCVLMISLVVLVYQGLEFLYQQESIPNVIFLRFLCLYQYESNKEVVNLLDLFWSSNSVFYFQS